VDSENDVPEASFESGGIAGVTQQWGMGRAPYRNALDRLRNRTTAAWSPKLAAPARSTVRRGSPAKRAVKAV